MLPENDIRQIGILGDGCAAMSLAARANELPGFRMTVYQPDDRPAQADHIWGFWAGTASATGGKDGLCPLAELEDCVGERRGNNDSTIAALSCHAPVGMDCRLPSCSKGSRGWI
jgi:hypothetical protein